MMKRCMKIAAVKNEESRGNDRHDKIGRRKTREKINEEIFTMGRTTCGNDSCNEDRSLKSENEETRRGRRDARRMNAQ